ncbi:MAG: hypothetical protein HQL65_06080 [Magnetococcales bacterium]|nr:hypothetical protein [Magnetococcales bacterium]
MALVREWATIHQSELMENWQRCANKQPNFRIPSLP